MYGYLMHHGVKGMKWGIRKYQNPDGTLTEAGKRRYSDAISGKNVTLLKKKNKFGFYYDIYSKDKVGQAIVDNNKDGGVTLDWIGIKPSERRRGYGKESLDLIIKDSIKNGKKYISLEAAGLDPAALHMYKKAGFETIRRMDDNDIWNGLIEMRKKL